MKKSLKYSPLSSYILKHSHLLAQDFENNRKAHDKLFKKCVILGHGKSGGRGEELSVFILMLRPSNINSVSSIIRLWTA